MSAHLAINNLVNTELAPSAKEFQNWVDSTLLFFPQFKHLHNSGVEIVFADSNTSAAINRQYRNKTNPTNVLSLNYEPLPGESNPLLGEIIFCPTVLEQEAHQQGKNLRMHYAHLTVHAMLHLLGYDHTTDSDADRMEQLEVQILTTLGISNPYQ